MLLLEGSVADMVLIALSDSWALTKGGTAERADYFGHRCVYIPSICMRFVVILGRADSSLFLLGIDTVLVK